MGELPKYKCEFRAAKIVKVEDLMAGGATLWFDNAGAVVVDAKYVGMNPNLAVGGYYVLYEDGYQSYVPAKTFERDCTPDEKMEGPPISRPKFTPDREYSMPALVTDAKGNPWWVNPVERTMEAAAVTRARDDFHDIVWAAHQLKNGFRIRRPGWSSHMLMHPEAATIVFIAEDLLATDWEIAP
jgi:hypothetical protein